MKVLGIVLSLALLALLLSGVTADDKKEPPNPAKAREPVELTEEGMRIHKEALLIDGHNDLPWQFREKKDLSFRKIDLMQAAEETCTPTFRGCARAASVRSSGRPTCRPRRGQERHRRPRNARTDRRHPSHGQGVSRHLRDGVHRRRHRAHPQGRQDRVADRRRGRPFHRQLARRAAHAITRSASAT